LKERKVEWGVSSPKRLGGFERKSIRGQGWHDCETFGKGETEKRKGEAYPLRRHRGSRV